MRAHGAAAALCCCAIASAASAATAAPKQQRGFPRWLLRGGGSGGDDHGQGLPRAAAAPPAFPFDGCPGGEDSVATGLLLKALNLSFPGMEGVKAAVTRGNKTAACNAVATHFATATTAAWLRSPAPRAGTARVGGSVDEVMINDTYDFYGEVSRVPREPDGGLDWHFYGPVGDDEFMYALNRHTAWAGFFQAWTATGNPEYARAFDARAADWTAHNLPAPSRDSDGNTTWRTIECGIRAGGTWAASFFGFQASAELRASTRCALVAAIAEHGRYLDAFGDAGNSNWRSMQYNGLGMISLVFPELNNALDWYAHAESKVLDDMLSGVYKDGIETEETSMYHKVALTNFDELLTDVVNSGRAPDPQMKAIVERMFGYLAFSLDTAGYSPLNSDSDTVYNADFIAAAAATFVRADWAYVASQGSRGTKPDGPPSTMFPWGGQLVSRSGWSKSDWWSWFDVGPYGSSGHGHRDKLHLSVRAGGVRLLVDSGRFSYDGALAPYRENYGVLSRAHNVLVVDGKQQVTTPATVTEPLANDTWAVTEEQDRARGSITFDGIEGKAVHMRSLVYQRGEFWVVVDRLTTDRPRSVEGLWHAFPNCSVVVSGGGGTHPTAHVTDSATGVGVDIVAAGGAHVAPWSNAIVIRGQTEPVLQGWYSPQYGTKLPSPVASYAASVPAGNATFVWVIVPTEGRAPSGASATVTLVTPTSVGVNVVVGGKRSSFTVAV